MRRSWRTAIDTPITPTSRPSMPKTTVRPIGSGLSVGGGMLVAREAGVVVGLDVVDVQGAPGVVVFVTNIVEVEMGRRPEHVED
jgi:hypothetical protein